MEDEEIVHMILKVTWKENKKQNDTYTQQNVEIFDNVANLRMFLFENFRDELLPAVAPDSFHLGYYDEKNRKLTITNTSQLAEAYSSGKDGWLKLWADPHVAPIKSKSTDSSKRNFSQFMAFNGHVDEEDKLNPTSKFDNCMSRLRAKQRNGTPDFKLKIWAKMLMNGTHSSEDVPPQLPFFTGKKTRDNNATNGVTCSAASFAGTQPAQPQFSIGETTVSGVDMEGKIRMRSALIQQLKDLKDLESSGLLTVEQFQQQREKLLQELNSL